MGLFDDILRVGNGFLGNEIANRSGGLVGGFVSGRVEEIVSSRFRGRQGGVLGLGLLGGK